MKPSISKSIGCLFAVCKSTAEAFNRSLSSFGLQSSCKNFGISHYWCCTCSRNLSQISHDQFKSTLSLRLFSWLDFSEKRAFGYLTDIFSHFEWFCLLWCFPAIVEPAWFTFGPSRTLLKLDYIFDLSLLSYPSTKSYLYARRQPFWRWLWFEVYQFTFEIECTLFTSVFPYKFIHPGSLFCLTGLFLN